MKHVNIIDSQNEFYKISFRPYEYPNLMELIVDHLYDDIGACLGRGLCGTCHIKLVSEPFDTKMSQQEKQTLSKLDNANENSRLACQILLNEKIHDKTFKIITEDYIEL